MITKGVFIMDYELMMNGNVKIGERAPEFEADSTMGKISLNDRAGGPGPAVLLPFTPVQGDALQNFLRLSYLTGRTCPRQGLAATFPTNFPRPAPAGPGRPRAAGAAEGRIPVIFSRFTDFPRGRPGPFCEFRSFLFRFLPET